MRHSVRELLSFFFTLLRDLLVKFTPLLLANNVLMF